MKKFNKIIYSFICSLLVVIMMFSGCTTAPITDTTTTNPTETTTETHITPESEQEIIVSDEVEELAQDTIEDVASGEDIATDEIIEGTYADEKEIVDEGVLETDATVDQENISYDGVNSGKGTSLLGDCTGITYFSQADSRWGSIMYSNHGDKNQTIKSSGCGPTSAAMIISSSKGVITPPTIAKLFVDNGYRTYDNGTAWSAWSFIADYFGFKEYYTTTSDSKMFSYLETDKNKDGISDYFVVASCGYGLFTTGGHYITIMGNKDNVLTVYDPYLYAGKFTTASRKNANVTVSGNTAYVTESNFSKYANTKQYWIFSNDYVNTTKPTDSTSGTTSTNTVKTVNYVRYVATKTQPLNVRKSASSTSSVITTLKKGTKVKVDKVDGVWYHITSPTTGWVSSSYLSSTAVTTSTTTSTTQKVIYKTTIGSLYRLKSDTTLYSKGSLSGTQYQYKALTQIKVIKHYSETVDYVYVVKTGRYAYCKVSAYTNFVSVESKPITSYKTTVGNFYRLKTDSILYSKGNLSGTKYQYKALTQVKIIKHYSETVDYVYVVKTGRYAYLKVSNLK